MIRKRLSPQPGKMMVRFEIPGSIWAERVNLVGDFNDWNHESLAFLRDRAGDWHIEVELESGQEYRFRYLLDGAYWRYDWHADKFVPNPQGGYDCIVVSVVPRADVVPGVSQ